MMPLVMAALVPLATGGVTRPSKRVGGSPDIPLSDVRNTPRAVEQVHLTGGCATGINVVWSANSSKALQPSIVQIRPQGSGEWTDVLGPPGSVYSALQFPAPWQLPKPKCFSLSNYTNPNCFYTSGVLHAVQLDPLTPGSAYEYRIKGDTRSFRFRTPPAAGAPSIRFGVVGDLGQTINSSATVQGMLGAVQDGSIDSVLFAGDLSYSDGDQYRWDSYARLFEPLWSSVVAAHVGGNHEVSNQNENWMAFSRRYPNSHLQSGSASFLWYSFEAGPAHVVMLCSYAAFSPGSSQYEWLVRDFAAVNRSVTPWLIVMLHVPWYTSNAHHPSSEGAMMREAMEPLFLTAGVDLVFNGHVHAYERTYPVARGEVAKKGSGIPFITIGDGGNREHFAIPWLPAQPSWSALREYAYGWGTLELNTTHAVWSWLRNDDPWNPPGGKVGDRAVYTLEKH